MTNDLSPEDLANLAKLFDLNAAQAGRHFSDLAAAWGLGGVQHRLTELLKGLRPTERPQVAVDLSAALAAYLEHFGPEGVVGQADTYRDHA